MCYPYPHQPIIPKRRLKTNILSSSFLSITNHEIQIYHNHRNRKDKKYSVGSLNGLGRGFLNKTDQKNDPRDICNKNDSAVTNEQ